MSRYRQAKETNSHNYPPQVSISHLREHLAQMSIRKYGNYAGEACRRVSNCHNWIFFSRDVLPILEVRRYRDASPLRKDARIRFVLGFDGRDRVAAERKANRRIRLIRKSDKHVRKLRGISGLIVVETACDAADFPCGRFIVGNLPRAD